MGRLLSRGLRWCWFPIGKLRRTQAASEEVREQFIALVEECGAAPVYETASGRFCCKSLKTPGDKFPARTKSGILYRDRLDYLIVETATTARAKIPRDTPPSWRSMT
jgi:hypothetical protein